MPTDPISDQVPPEARPAPLHPSVGGEDIQRLPPQTAGPGTVSGSWGQAADPAEVELRLPDAMAVFFAWERLRLLYNLILAVVAFGALFSSGWDPRVWLRLPEDVLMANVCFCAGPVAEGYLCWVGVSRRAARWLVFLPGTWLAAWFASAALQPPFPGGGFLN